MFAQKNGCLRISAKNGCLRISAGAVDTKNPARP